MSRRFLHLPCLGNVCYFLTLCGLYSGPLLEVDSDVDVVASSGMCVGAVRAGIVAVVSAKALLMTPPSSCQHRKTAI